MESNKSDIIDILANVRQEILDKLVSEQTEYNDGINYGVMEAAKVVTKEIAKLKEKK